MYTIILDEGLVIRDSDSLQIAPCSDESDQNFLDYIEWVNSGNQPSVFNTRSEIQVE